MISGYLIGDRKLITQMDGMSAKVQREIFATVDKLGRELILRVVYHKLSGQVLKRRTGRLAASIARNAPETRSRFEETAVSATSYVGTNVSYGKTWEYGAHVPAYDIFPKNRQALRFMMNGKEIFAKHVHMPARDIKARPFLAPALQEMKPFIIAELQAVLLKATQDALKS